MSQLKIYRASAGSGKTYALTEKYLKLLFKNPVDYRHILAVTFTNKATAEMRARILDSLYGLSDESLGNSDYMQELKKTFSISEKQVRERAALILYFLLHDYSRFSVSTIDSFFQQTIRSFSREMNLSSGFRLELKPDPLMRQAIDNMIFEMERPENADLKNWLVSFAESRIENEKNWNINNEIFGISKLIYSEIYQEKSKNLSIKLKDKKELKVYKNQLQKIKNEIDNQLKSIGEKALKIIESRGLDILNDFEQKSRSKVKIFLKMKSLEDFIDEKSYFVLLDEPEKWIGKSTSKETQKAVIEAYHAGLNELLHNAKSLVDEKSGDYFTALAILENINALGIINDVNQKLNEVCRDKNLFLISGTNHLLNSIISNNETPFLYEKTGVLYSHFMIDEFQDTSTLQYKNFMPLIKESLSNDNFSLFVGDVKQAIYRWRNSDWNLLAETAENNFQNYGTEINVLDVNWRSSEEIINFNNSFFTDAPSLLQSLFNEMVPEKYINSEWFGNLESKIKNIYLNVSQKVSPVKEGSGGHIFVRFFEGNKTEKEEDIIRDCVAHIAHLIESGYKKSEICVLVRKNEESFKISNALMLGDYHPEGEKLDVFGNDALLLSESEAVKILVAKLKFIRNPEDILNESFIRTALDKISYKSDNEYNAALFVNTEKVQNWNDYKENLLSNSQLPLYELVESLVNLLPSDFHDDNSIYLQSFLSVVHDFMNQENADLGFFLDYWDKKKDSQTLSISENEDSIRVLTVHKAKGLEFKAVVIPFFTWEIKNPGSLRNYLWVQPETEPFNYLNLVPVKEKKDLIYSHFAKEYLTEVMCQYVDNLNLAYVAFTRAKESLSVFANIKKPENKNIQTVADLLFLFLSEKDLLIASGESDFSYQKGKISIINEPNDKLKKRIETNIEIKPQKLNPLRERIEFHFDSSDYLDDKDDKTRGKLMHRLFENIITVNDIDKALNQFKNKGIISSYELPDLKQFIINKINDPTVNKWFNGSYEVRTEPEIISQNNKRPDRVMFGDNEVIVVDYKFGTIKSPSHIKQVEEYVRLLATMGYQNVKGYVWYVSLNRNNLFHPADLHSVS